MPAEVLLARVVCKTLVPPARKVGLYLPDLLHVLVVRCITRAPHTCPIRHRLIICIDYRLPVAAHICYTYDAIEKAYFARAVEIWRSDNCKHCLHVSLFLFQRLAQSKPSQSRHLCSESWPAYFAIAIHSPCRIHCKHCLQWIRQGQWMAIASQSCAISAPLQQCGRWS